AKRTHRQCGPCGQHDVFLGYAELMGQRIEEKYDDEKIKRVQRPAKKAGEYSVVAGRPRRFIGRKICHGSRRIMPRFALRLTLSLRVLQTAPCPNAAPN